MNWLKFCFLSALFVNGVGSCALAIAYPFYLINLSADASLVFRMESLIFMAAALGLFFWGKILDSSISIWQLKFVVILLEFLASLVFLFGIDHHLGYQINGLFIAILEFLFAFELPWSRIAFLKLPKHKNTTSEESAREISMAATMITLLAPAIGAGMGGFSVKTMAIINILSSVPYMIICIYLGWNQPTEAFRTGYKETKSITDENLYSTRWQRLLVGYTFMTLAPAAMMSALPLVLSQSSTSKQDIIVFYLLSGLALTTSGIKRVRDIVSPFLTGRLPIISGGLIIGTFIFLVGESIWIKVVGYAAHNIFWLALSIDVTNVLYSPEFEKKRGRIFSLFQMAGKFSFPTVAALLSIFSNQTYMLGTILVVTLSVILGTLILNRSMLTELLLRRGLVQS